MGPLKFIGRLLERIDRVSESAMDTIEVSIASFNDVAHIAKDSTNAMREMNKVNWDNQLKELTLSTEPEIINPKT